jgi:DNA-binding CsgD family transcriptional regulator
VSEGSWIETSVVLTWACADTVLRGRKVELAALDRILDDVAAGRSGTLVLRGDAGEGKTALLEHAIERARGCRVERAAGVESEMELAFAGLHQLCAPMLDGLDRLPDPQRAALETAFGLSAGSPPDRFFVGLAFLGLLADTAHDRPLLCVVDDAQWLDDVSAQVLAFVARRLQNESVALLFATRAVGERDALAGLPELVVHGLGERDARALLTSVMPGTLDERVRDRIVAETRGNPLALLELPRGFTVVELAGGYALPPTSHLSGQIEESFRRRAERLDHEIQRLLIVAAAEPTGDPVLLRLAAARLGLGVEPAVTDTDGLLHIGTRVEFTHPLARSAVYQSASPDERRGAHVALAEVTDPDIDPDRRAWHRAHAAAGPDEEVASELERSAGRAQARGGMAAAAAFLEQAAELTPDPADRAGRSLAAARAKYAAGAPEEALALVTAAAAGPLGELDRARVQLLQAQIVSASSRGSEAPPLLLAAARRFEPLDVRLARETYLDALVAAMFAGSLATRGGLFEVAAAIRACPPSTDRPRATDLLLDGLAVRLTDGYVAAAPVLQRALRGFRDEPLSTDESTRWLWLACHTAHELWDDEAFDELSTRELAITRDAGALAVLPLALIARLYMDLNAGDLGRAELLIEELETVVELTGSHMAPYGALELAALRGRADATRELIDERRNELELRGEGLGISLIHYATALLCNGLGRHEEAYEAALEGVGHPAELGASTWQVPDLIEAAARTGNLARGRQALDRLAQTTRASGTEWALGTEARCRALLTEDERADELYREAIDRLGRTRLRLELARAHLVYGEWLRREGQRGDARDHLRTAHEMFTAMGTEAFAGRAARELHATGEATRGAGATAVTLLTAQEAKIASLAREGLSNPEIGLRLFISARTVEWHLRNVFTKLGIGSRRELPRALGDGRQIRTG